MKNIISKSKRKGAKISELDRLLSLPYKIELTPLSKKDGGGYLAVIPLLKGCASDGKTPDEAIINLREAQKAWFESSLNHNDSIPIPQ
jgi:antitoxin HicB